MDAEPPPMVRPNLAALIWARARAIPDSPGAWGRFLASVMAAMWSVALWKNGNTEHWSGTAEMVDLLGVHFTSMWMLGAAVFSMIGLIVGWLPLRMLTGFTSFVTWLYLLFEMLVHGHAWHLSTASCMVGVLACVRADFMMWALLARRYR